MKNHTKIYLKHFGYGEQDFIPCEVCGSRAVDIHHIKARGMGGVAQNRLDVIENLQAVCRCCHIKHGDKPQSFDLLVKQHSIKLNIKIATLTDKLNTL